MKMLHVFAVAACLVLAATMARAEEGAMAPAAENSAGVEVGNKLCPVSGEEVGKMGPVQKVEHNGKVYNLCCPMCVKDFKKDPEKFAKKAEDEVASEAKN